MSEREREIAAEVGAGKSNVEIGAALFLSVPTVKKHVSHILTTLDLNNRVQIALLVHDADLGDGPDADLYPVQPQSGLELPRGETMADRWP